MRSIRRAVLYFLASAFSGAQVGLARILEPIARLAPSESVTSATKRILVISMGGIGDHVLVLPILIALRKKYESHEIMVVVRSCSVGMKDVAGACIDKELSYKFGVNPCARLLEPIRAMRFVLRNGLNSRPDLAIVPRWDKDNTGAAFIAFFSAAKTRLAFSERVDKSKMAWNWLYDKLYTDLDAAHATQPEANKIASLVANHECVTVPSLAGLLRPNRVEKLEREATVFAIAPFAGQFRKDWHPTRWSQLICALGKRFQPSQFLIFCGSENRAKAHQIADAAHQNCRLMVGNSFASIIAEIAAADLLVGADTGVAHLAGAAGIPVIQLSCHPQTASPGHYSSPLRWAAVSPRTVVIQPTANRGCEDACEARQPCCINNIEVSTVLNTVENYFGTPIALGNRRISGRSSRPSGLKSI
jgi:ADP-heptose:LPS heptosyltransferase